MFSSLVGAKLVIAAVAGSLSIGGVAAAAVTGALPGPLDHTTTVSASDSSSADPSGSATPTESPDPSESASPSVTTDPTQASTSTAVPSTSTTSGPVGPDATGPAAFGLCHAFGGSKSIGKANNPSIAYRNLLTAATSAGQTVETYCATILGTPVPTTDPSGTATTPTVAAPHGKGHGHGHGSGRGRPGQGA